jgi:uncharacterized repeat protein (TIGR03803 family)
VPDGTLIVANDGSGLLYGVTTYGAHPEGLGSGSIYSMDAQGKVVVLHAFEVNREGAMPNGPLVQTADGALWGTTQIGGKQFGGAVFRLRTDGFLEVMHSFDFLDGITPTAGLMLAADGSLWGTTSYNGLGNSGTVFRIDQKGNFSVVRNFGDQGGAGTHPLGRLVQKADGSVWGTTSYTTVHGSVPGGGGTVFRIAPDGSFAVMNSLSDVGCPDGCRPSAGLAEGGDGWLYGTATVGGRSGGGTVFRVDDAGVVQVVHAFKAGPALDGSFPFGDLLRSSDGALYGTTWSGGTKKSQQGPGTVFKIDAAGAYSQLHVFQCLKTGCGPHSGLVETAPGVFVGTAPNAQYDITHGGSVWQITDR